MTDDEGMRFFVEPLLTNLLKQAKVVFATEACRFQIVADDEYGHFAIDRDHDGARNPGFNVGTMPA